MINIVRIMDKDWRFNMFCKHKNLIFIMNIYGDEINYISLNKIYRSEWKCKKCGKIIYKGELYSKDSNVIKPNYLINIHNGQEDRICRFRKGKIYY